MIHHDHLTYSSLCPGSNQSESVPSRIYYIMSQAQQTFGGAILNPMLRSTCCGTRKDGQSCGNPVARASRYEAYTVLEQVQDLPSNSAILRRQLKKVAHLLLCKRWHQDQWQRLARDWLSAWNCEQEDSESEYESRRENERSRSAAQGSLQRRATRLASRSSGRSQQGAQISPYETLVQAILRSDISNDAKISILQGATSSNHGNSQSFGSQTIETSTDVATVDTTSPTSQSPSEREAPSNSPLSPSMPVSRPVQPDSVTPPTQRASHSECGICYEPYNDDDSENGVAFWECLQCLNRTHWTCHLEWSQSREPQRPTCSYCRAIVPSILS